MKSIIKANRFTIILLAIFALYYFYHQNETQRKIADMKSREIHLSEKLSELNKEVQRLEDYYELSQTPEFIERLAREKLKMVRPDEVIYYIKKSKENKDE